MTEETEAAGSAAGGLIMLFGAGTALLIIVFGIGFVLAAL